MCEFQYNDFDQCGHRVIETTQYCQEAKWRAGMTGKLTPCAEVVFNFHLTRQNGIAAVVPDGFTEQLLLTYAWNGIHGLCKSCTRQQKLPESTAFTNDRILPLSHFSGPAIVAQILSQRKNAPRQGLATPEHPFVHMPTLLSSVFELLGIADQYSTKDQSTCKVLAFPAANFLYTKDAWTSVAFVNGVEINGIPNTFLYANCGLTSQDRSFIDNQVIRGLAIEDIYRIAYERRGMPKDKFVEAVHKGVIMRPAKTISRVEGLQTDGVFHAHPDASQPEVEQPAASLLKTPARSRKASIASAATTAVVNTKPRAAGIRKTPTPRKKSTTTPRKVSVVENALMKTPAQYLPPPTINAAIDPLLLAQSSKKSGSVEAQEDAMQKYTALKMPPVKAKTLATSETIRSYSERLLTLSAAAKKSSNDVQTDNVVVATATTEARAQIADMLSPSPETPNTSTSLGSNGNAYDSVTSANAALSTPLKWSPNSNSSAKTSPIYGVDAAERRQQNLCEADTPIKALFESKAADAAATFDDEMFSFPFHDSTPMRCMGVPYPAETTFANTLSNYKLFDSSNDSNCPASDFTEGSAQNDYSSIVTTEDDYLFTVDFNAKLKAEPGHN